MVKSPATAKPNKRVPQAINRHPFYHRKIAHSGSSRYLAVSRMLPEDWLMVKVEVKKIDRKVCVLEITKLD